MASLTSMPVTLSTTRSGCSSFMRVRSCLLREQLRLMLLLERLDELIQLPVHHLRELVEGELDAVVGHAALREVVGADALGAIAAADLQAARLRLGALLLLLLGRQQPCLEERERAGAVLVLRALVLALHHDAARQVGDAHRGVGLVDVLAAGARGAKGV